MYTLFLPDFSKKYEKRTNIDVLLNTWNTFDDWHYTTSDSFQIEDACNMWSEMFPTNLSMFQRIMFDNHMKMYETLGSVSTQT